MLIKVCGNKKNIGEVSQCKVDLLGLIFAQESPRYFDWRIEPDPNKLVKGNQALVGVFVNSDISIVSEVVSMLRLDYVQLHGSEPASYLAELRKLHSGLKIIKSINILTSHDLSLAYTYEDYCDFLLFDSCSAQGGGSGEKFNWSILSEYLGKREFILAGGISPNSAQEVLTLQGKLPKMVGIDINSRFEKSPGLKDNKLIDTFIGRLNCERN